MDGGWLVGYYRPMFYIPLENTFGEELQKLGLCSALNLVPHLLRHGASVFVVSSKGSLNLVALHDKQGILKANTRNLIFYYHCKGVL